MLLAPLIERIGDQVPQLRQVIAAASAPLAIAALKTYPSACVVMPRGAAGKNTIIGAINQQVNDSFAVILAVRNVKDMQGVAAFDEMDALRLLSNTALLGWQFDTGYDPIEYAGYQLVAYQDGLLFWADHFVTRHFQRVTGSH